MTDEEKHILERMKHLANDIHSDLLIQDNFIPNEPNIESALEYIEELEQLLKTWAEMKQ